MTHKDIIDPSTRVLAFTPRDQVVSNLQSVNIYSVFRAIPQKLWLLWELGTYHIIQIYIQIKNNI